MDESGEVDVSSVDLSLPDSLSHDEKVRRLHEIGRQLVEVTGKKSGTTPPQQSDSGQPVWAMWWGDDENEDQ
jgi:hypothetical protein